MNDRDVKRIFRKAAGDVEPDVSRFADSVPELIAEARRRRERAGGVASLVPLARRVVPRLAAAAAILVIAAMLVGTGDGSESANGSAGLDRLMLTGEVSSESSDILLEAIAQGGRDDG
jgi:hypothetical protein